MCATRSSIGAPGFGGGAGEIGLAGIAGAVAGGCVSMSVGMTGLFDGELPDAAEVTGGTAAMGTDGLPAARPPGAVEGGAGVTLVAGTTGLPGVGLPGAIEGGRATLAARFGLPAAGALDAAESAGGVTMAAGTTTLFAARSPGAVEGGGAILVARDLGLRTAVPPRALERMFTLTN